MGKYDDDWFLERWMNYIWDWFRETFGFFGDILAGIFFLAMGAFVIFKVFPVVWYLYEKYILHRER